MPEKKSRIEFIDLAKGFCILIVVFFHISRALEVSYPLDELTSKIRMPLYYILSGLFFKEYENFGGFLKRKTNKLIIPFLFAYICISSPYMFYKDYSLGLPLSSIANHILLGVYHKNFINMVIWFLLSLFITSIFFYLIVIVSKRFGERKVMMLILLSLAIGFVGVLLAYSRTRLPLYLDTSLTATPLYSLGYILNKHSNILRKSKIDRYLLLIIPSIFGGRTLQLCNQSLLDTSSIALSLLHACCLSRHFAGQTDQTYPMGNLCRSLLGHPATVSRTGLLPCHQGARPFPYRRRLFVCLADICNHMRHSDRTDSHLQEIPTLRHGTERPDQSVIISASF